MKPNDKVIGACAAVLVIAGLTQIDYVIASIQLSGISFSWFRLCEVLGFLFLGSDLYRRGPRFARFAAALIGVHIASGIPILFYLSSVGQFIGFALPTTVHIAAIVALIRLSGPPAIHIKEAQPSDRA